MKFRNTMWPFLRKASSAAWGKGSGSGRSSLPAAAGDQVTGGPPSPPMSEQREEASATRWWRVARSAFRVSISADLQQKGPGQPRGSSAPAAAWASRT